MHRFTPEPARRQPPRPGALGVGSKKKRRETQQCQAVPLRSVPKTSRLCLRLTCVPCPRCCRSCCCLPLGASFSRFFFYVRLSDREAERDPSCAPVAQQQSPKGNARPTKDIGCNKNEDFHTPLRRRSETRFILEPGPTSGH